MNDVVLAIYSDRLFMAAVGVYVLAMVLHAAEYATLRAATRRRRSAPADTRSPSPPLPVRRTSRVRERRRVRSDDVPLAGPLRRECRWSRRRSGPGPTGSAGRR